MAYTNNHAANPQNSHKGNRAYDNFGVTLIKAFIYPPPKIILPPSNNSGSRIRWARQILNLTQKEVALKLGVREHTIIIIERKGSRNIKMIRDLSSVLEQPVWFLGCFEKLPEETLSEQLKKSRAYHGLTLDESRIRLNVGMKSFQFWQSGKLLPNKKSYQKLISFLSILKIPLVWPKY